MSTVKIIDEYIHCKIQANAKELEEKIVSIFSPYIKDIKKGLRCLMKKKHMIPYFLKNQSKKIM